MCRIILDSSRGKRLLRAACLGILALFVSLLVSSPPVLATPHPYLVKDIKAGTGSNPLSLTALTDKLIFLVPQQGGAKDQLWVSDGTRRGTRRIKSLPGISTDASEPFVVANNKIFFTGTDRVHGSEPWTSDGTTQGTRLLLDIVPGPKGQGATFVFAGGKWAYFYSAPYYEVIFLWGTNGKKSTTRFIGNIAPSPVSNSSTAIGNTLYFSGGEFFDQQLWKSNGTMATTSEVKEIYPNGNAAPSFFTSNGSSFWFFANDSASKLELWKSDGTADGTQSIKNIGALGDLFILAPKNVQGTLYFVVHRNATRHLELWKSDGTAQGTGLFQDLGPIGQYSELAAVGNTLYFVANQGADHRQLWKSNGTPEGTTMLLDLQVPIGGEIRDLTVVDSRLFYSADDGVHGAELWQSDGTPEGTNMVVDINPNGSANPNWLTNVNGTLFFTANDGKHGTELWAYKP